MHLWEGIWTWRLSWPHGARALWMWDKKAICYKHPFPFHLLQWFWWDEAEIVVFIPGDSGQGMTYSGIAGISITDLNLNKEYPLAEVYSPSRCLPLSPDLLQSVGEEVSQTVQVSYQFHSTLARRRFTKHSWKYILCHRWDYFMSFRSIGVCMYYTFSLHHPFERTSANLNRLPASCMASMSNVLSLTVCLAGLTYSGAIKHQQDFLAHVMVTINVM